MGQGLLLLAVGALGALIAEWIGIPTGMIVGALLTSGLYRLAGGEPGAWQGRYGRVGRLLLGTFIGPSFGPDVIVTLKAALVPTLVLIVCIIGAGLGLGWTLGRFTKLDPTTVLISAVPGGLPAMVGMAEKMDADATVVTPLDSATALLSSVPGGASTMLAVAHDLGGDLRLVASIHLARQLVVLILVPPVLDRFLRGRHRQHIAPPKTCHQ